MQHTWQQTTNKRQGNANTCRERQTNAHICYMAQKRMRAHANKCKEGKALQHKAHQCKARQCTPMQIMAANGKQVQIIHTLANNCKSMHIGAKASRQHDLG